MPDEQPDEPRHELIVSRRDFLRASTVGAAALVVGCGAESGAPGSSDADSIVPDVYSDRPDAPLTPGCEETQENTEGPFYRAGAPERDTLIVPSDPGVRLVVSGTVFVRDSKMACVPLAGGLLDIWQADNAGAYDSVGFNFRGHLFCGPDGSYALHTIVPGHYLNGAQFRPAHIHVKASGAKAQLLTTQLYFEGDPYNDIDPFIHPALIMPLTDDGSGGKAAHFDIVLAPA